MCYFLHAELLEEFIIQSPADIVMAADIILEQATVLKLLELSDLIVQKPYIRCRERVPDCAHRRNIIEHVAFRFSLLSKVRDNFLRLHDDFAKQHDARADDSAGKVHHAHQRMDFRQISAVCAQCFPNIRDCIQADDIDSLIRQIQQIVCHIVKDHGISVIEVPLERIK